MPKSALKFTLTALITAAFVVAASLSLVFESGWQSAQFSQPAVAQSNVLLMQPGQQVYELMPELPQENQYVSVETGEISTNNTLVSRLIQYHLYVKGRPPNYRLDWKLTLADYLGANEWMVESAYPGADTLQPHPMAGDIAAIGHLNRAQRDALVDALVSVFSSTGARSTPSQPAPAPSSSGAVQSQPGAAQLLLP
jgi:hypothetical protein